MKIHLITGSTGFVGKYLVNALLEKGEHVWVIVRRLNDISVQKRAEEIFEDYILKWPKAFRVIEGDIMIKNLGIRDDIIEDLKNYEVELWHLAANLSFAAENKSDVQRANYIGTINTVEFANRIAKKFIHMSTAYVCGDSNVFKENELFKGQKLRNHYERSKMAAEMYVRQNCKLPFIIFRPSIIIGDAYQGKAEGCTFGYYRYAFMFYFLKKQIIKVFEKKGIGYYFFKIMGTKYDSDKNILIAPWLVVPYPRKGRVDMVTVDYVIKSMINIYEENVEGVSVHITHSNPPAHHFILHSIIYDVGLRKMKLIPIPPRIFGMIIRSFYFLAIPVRKYIKSVMWYIPYVTETCHFERAIIEKYGENPPEISRELISKINLYAKENILEHIEI